MNDYFVLLEEISDLAGVPLPVKYKQLRDLFERFCREQMEDENLRITDLSARINYISTKSGWERATQNSLHTFRINAARILNGLDTLDPDIFLADLQTVSSAVARITKEPVPAKLCPAFPDDKKRNIPQMPAGNRIKRMRVCFLYADEHFLYVNPSDFLAEEPWKVRYQVQGVNDPFSQTIDRLWPYAQLNLLDVTVEGQGVCIPSFIVLEPDYLIDISSLAECYKDYGSHPANYSLNKLSPVENTRHLLLGNIVNLFLDEWIHADGEADYSKCMQKAFRNYPIELATCEDLKNREQELQFFADCKMHFENIRKTVQETFPSPGYRLDRTDALLEPSYICEALGIQGRLDYLQRDMKSFIEMKSGRADEYIVPGKVEPKENNKVQMLLYMAVLEYNMNIDHRLVHPYLFYTRYPLLYPSSPAWRQVKRVIDLRNRIVAREYQVQLHNDPAYTASVLAEINSATLNERKLKGKFWEHYLRPSTDVFREQFDFLPDMEKSYFLHQYNFITKELYLSKSGGSEYENRAGSSSLWLSALSEKQEGGEILIGLHMISNQAADKEKPSVAFSIPAYQDDFLPNFRPGDAVLFYERNSQADNVTNKIVFKGSIEMLSSQQINIRMKAAQKNVSVLPGTSEYAVEHDYMDSTFKNMFQGLHAFLVASNERRALLLAQRAPGFDDKKYEAATKVTDDFERIALKAIAAQDYLLLLGPPGTGKTSRALKRMVELFHAIPDTQLLLLAYTNRAVDQICKSVSTIDPAVDFIRIGSELSCDPLYRAHLLEKKLASCSKRSEVVNCLSGCRVFIGTVASVSARNDLFKLKTFDVAIIDEATQILESQLLNILCSKKLSGQNAIGKFILIGDHKQLPAVVLQDAHQSVVTDPALQKIGLHNLKDSLFERLYRHHLKEESSQVVEMLCRQGRMNPAIAEFPNRAFYGGKLLSAGLEHQSGELCFPDGWGVDKWEQVLTRRIAFIPSTADRSGHSLKVNRQEAKIVAGLALRIYKCHGKAFDPTKTLGIIAPYRNQIALIKKELSLLNISELNEIAVDTIERFQGSERDIILYSFCINHSFQLKLMSNLTYENEIAIDRKLNVALTRARKQLILTGVPELLSGNFIYLNLLKLINDCSGFTELYKN